jgi:uncharacterized membrane protein YgcG
VARELAEAQEKLHSPLDRVFVKLSEFIKNQRLTVMQMFRQFDADHNGMLDEEELDNIFSHIGIRLTPAEKESVVRHFDVDGDRCIDYREFYTAWMLFQKQAGERAATTQERIRKVLEAQEAEKLQGVRHFDVHHHLQAEQYRHQKAELQRREREEQLREVRAQNVRDMGQQRARREAERARAAAEEAAQAQEYVPEDEMQWNRHSEQEREGILQRREGEVEAAAAEARLMQHCSDSGKLQQPAGNTGCVTGAGASASPPGEGEGGGGGGGGDAGGGNAGSGGGGGAKSPARAAGQTVVGRSTATKMSAVEARALLQKNREAAPAPAVSAEMAALEQERQEILQLEEQRAQQYAAQRKKKGRRRVSVVLAGTVSSAAVDSYEGKESSNAADHVYHGGSVLTSGAAGGSGADWRSQQALGGGEMLYGQRL